MQKTNISSLLIVILSALNIILSSFFVLTLNLDVFGVALGTLISTNLTMIIFITYSYFYILKNFQIKPRLNGIIMISKFKKLFSLNFDIFLRTLFLTFSFLWVTYLGSKLGEDFLAVNTILMQFLIFAAFFLDAYAYSTEGIIGFAIGRKNKKSFLTAVKNSIQISLVTALLISIFYLFFFKNVINILTDIEVLRFLSFKYFIWIVLLVPIASLAYQLDGIFIGASQTKEMRNGMIFSVILFLIISIYSIKFFENDGIWFSLVIFMILRSVTLNYFFKRILKRF